MTGPRVTSGRFVIKVAHRETSVAWLPSGWLCDTCPGSATCPHVLAVITFLHTKIDPTERTAR